MKILIVDDEKALRMQLCDSLERQRYIVETAVDGDEALDKLFEDSFDLVILDIMMPGIDGLTVLKEMRKGGIITPVLLLTAKNSAEDKVKGLDNGADDYLAKPFSLDELMARVRALLRRVSGQAESLLQVGSLKLDTVTRTITNDGPDIELTPREFSILEFLLYNKNRVISRFSLAEHVWGDDFDSFKMSNFMDVHIKNLRHKINSPGSSSIIQTVRGVGYIVKDIADDC